MIANKSCLNFIFTALVCISISSTAQNILWTRQSEDVAFGEGIWSGKMRIDTQGNIITLYRLIGSVKLEGELIQSNGPDDILLVKYNPNGMIIWKRVMGGTSSDFEGGLAIDLQNNILITGSMPEGGDFLGNTLNIENGRAVAAKISPDGYLIWIKQFAGPTSFGNSISIDANNNVVAGIQTTKNEVVVFKYTPDGSLIWQKSFFQNACCSGPIVTDIKVDTNNRVIISGDFFWQLEVDGHFLQGTASRSAFVCALRENGTYEWSNVIDAPRSILDEARSMEMDIDGSNNIYITGYFETKATFGSIVLNTKESTDDRNTFLTKISPSGEFKWANALYGHDVLPGGIEINRATQELSICVAANQSFNYADQYISSILGDQTLILTTDFDGNFRQASLINHEAYPSYQADILFTKSNEFYVLGTFYHDFAIGCFNLDGGSQFTSFLLKGGVPEIQINNVSGFCLGETLRIQLAGSGVDQATKFKWLLPSGAQSVTGSTETIDNFIDILINDDFVESILKIVSYYDCYPQTEFSTILHEQVELPNTPATPHGDTVICVGSKFQYIIPLAEGATEFEWVLSSNLDGETSVDNSILLSTEVVDQVGFIQVKAINQCGESPLSSALKIRLNPTPSKPIVTGPDEVCAGKSDGNYMTHGETNITSFGWDYPPALKIKNSNQDSSAVSFTFPKDRISVTFYALSKGLCGYATSDPVEVKIIPLLPELSLIQGESEICKNDNNLHYSVEVVNQPVSYHWSYPNGFVKKSEQDNSILLEASNHAQSGAISVYISNKCFASRTETFMVTVRDIPDKPLIELEECDRRIQYDGTDNFTWFRNNEILGILTNVVELADSGHYKIKVANSCGTIESDEVVAYPVISEKLFFPNVITPNHDDLNTYFIIDRSLKGSVLEIFNRWGKSIYQSNNYNNNWDGGELSDGVYYYVLNNVCLSKSIKGIIQIVH